MTARRWWSFQQYQTKTTDSLTWKCQWVRELLKNDSLFLLGFPYGWSAFVCLQSPARTKIPTLVIPKTHLFWFLIWNSRIFYFYFLLISCPAEFAMPAGACLCLIAKMKFDERCRKQQILKSTREQLDPPLYVRIPNYSGKGMLNQKYQQLCWSSAVLHTLFRTWPLPLPTVCSWKGAYSTCVAQYKPVRKSFEISPSKIQFLAKK